MQPFGQTVFPQCIALLEKDAQAWNTTKSFMHYGVEFHQAGLFFVVEQKFADRLQPQAIAAVVYFKAGFLQTINGFENPFPSLFTGTKVQSGGDGFEIDTNQIAGHASVFSGLAEARQEYVQVRLVEAFS